MRAILIDPGTSTIEEIDTDGSLGSLREMVGGYIEAVHVSPGHHCYVNEEGLLNQPGEFFGFTDGHQPLAGPGVVLAETPEGAEAPCGLSLDWVKANVTFMNRDEALNASRDLMFHAALAASDYAEPESDGDVEVQQGPEPEEPDMG